MAERHSNQFTLVALVTVGLIGTSFACSKEEPPPASAASANRGATFRFAPPDGTEYIRTDRRTEEIAIVGAPLRRIDNDELRWRIRVERDKDEYRAKQDLIYISLARDGQTLVQGEIPEGISATLLIDPRGNLTGLKGLDRTAQILRSLVSPGKEAEAEPAINAESLAEVIASRYQVLFADTIGRPATPGSSWTVKNPPGSFVVSRTVTVARHEACGAATCARLQVEFQLDPKIVANAAANMVKSTVSATGADPSKVTVRSANYAMRGWMLVEPATMLSHGASLNEGGTVAVADPSGLVLTIELKGVTALSYEYTKGPNSQLSQR